MNGRGSVRGWSCVGVGVVALGRAVAHVESAVVSGGGVGEGAGGEYGGVVGVGVGVYHGGGLQEAVVSNAHAQTEEAK